MSATRDLDALRAYLVVAEVGSIAGAAAISGVPRATLDRRIDSLEQSIGRTVLLRDAHGVRPTPAGRLLLERGRELVQAYDRWLESSSEAALSDSEGGH